MNRCWYLLPALLALVGCGESPEVAYPIKGTVKLDGKPLESGEVYFLTEGKPPVIVPVKNGEFEGKATAGIKKVQLHAYRVGKATSVSGPGAESAEPPRENYLPARYHSASTETREVSKTGPNVFDFELTSK